jgi:transposase-like protein
MTVISEYPQSFIPEDIEAAIREHLEDPQKSVSRICRERKVSRATFYRWLPKVSVPDLPSEDSRSCPLCGAEFSDAPTDRELLVHLDSCPKASEDLRIDARYRLWEIDRCMSRSVLPPSTSMTSESTPAITSELSRPLSDTESESTVMTSAAIDDTDAEWNEFVHDLKTQLYGEPEEDMELYREKYRR